MIQPLLPRELTAIMHEGQRSLVIFSENTCVANDRKNRHYHSAVMNSSYENTIHGLFPTEQR